ncbi:Hypothetical predicted protein [Octopus vulgaris]|uniref:Uncharacterized protein n=1 Tax=Octopus vulgaris TaxID=6645 RepID=A0AA36AND4_OCTVU|nr:Hypothetical predicted protein [Octopus vulgaris]
MNANRGEYSDILRKKKDKETDEGSSDSDSSLDYGKRKSRVSYLGPIFLNRISSEIGNSDELNRLRTTGSPTLEQMVMCEIQNIGEKLDIKVHPWISSDNTDSADNVNNANNNNNNNNGSFCESGSTSSCTSSGSSPTQQRGRKSIENSFVRQRGLEELVLIVRQEKLRERKSLRRKSDVKGSFDGDDSSIGGADAYAYSLNEYVVDHLHKSIHC